MITIKDKIKNDLKAPVTDVQYLLVIDEKIYIATRKQMFGVDENAQYYEDRDLKISRIGEKIDLKTNKIQLSSVNITLSNYPVDSGVYKGGDRISNFASIVKIGAKIDIYLKTQSCESLSDCMQIAKVKITRLDHDESKVKITADDIGLDSFYKQLPNPNYVLNMEENTFPNYNLKPIPILYGHLESAPSVVRVKDMHSESYNKENNIELLFDTAEVDSNIDVDGAKQMQITSSLNGSYKLRTNLVNNDVVQIKIGDSLCSVSCFPYLTTRPEIKGKWGYGQFRSTYPSKIKLRTNTGTNETLLTSGALWVHTNSKPIGNRAYKIQSFYSDQSESTQKIFSVWKSQIAGSTMSGNLTSIFDNLLTEKYTGINWSQFTGEAYEFWGEDIVNQQIMYQSYGVQVIEFDPVPSASIYSETDATGIITEFPTDVNMTGNVEIDINADPESRNYKSNIWGCPSGINLDPTAQAEFYGYAADVSNQLATDNVGNPSAISSNFLSQVEHDYKLFPYWLNWYLSGGAVFRLDLGGDDEQPYNQNYASYLTHPTIYRNLGRPYYVPAWIGSSYEGVRPFESSFHSTKDIPDSEAWEDEELVANWKPIDSNEIALYYTQDPYVNPNIGDGHSYYRYDEDESGGASPVNESYIGRGRWTSLQPTWSNVTYRRMWAESDVFNKDFFVNAKGRLGKEEPHVTKVSGYFVQWNEGLTWTEPSADYSEYINLHGHKNDHINSFYKILTDIDQKRISVEGIACELMFHRHDSNGHSFIYDIDIEDISATNNVFQLASETDVTIQSRPKIGSYNPASDEYYATSVSHNVGVVLEFTGKIFHEGELAGLTGESSAYDWWYGGELVYAWKNYNENGEINGIYIIDSETIDSKDLDDFNNANQYLDQTQHGWNTSWGYTQVHWEKSQAQTARTLVRNPAEIVKHITEKELNIANFDLQEKYSEAYRYNKNIELNFSINEVQSSKDVIEKVCEQSRSFFRYRAADGMGVFETIKDYYNDFDIDSIIDVDRIIKYKFSKTKVEDLCFGGVRVKYKYNYAKESYDAVTQYKRLSTSETAHYKNYYDVEDEKYYEKEIEAPYIQDEASALQLRNFYFELNKNQHLLCKFTLPISDGLKYEVGDIVKFSDNPNGLFAYGKDIKISGVIVNQTYFPYFLITSVSKTEKEVEIDAYQLHKLNILTTYPTLIGDADLNGSVNENDIQLLVDHMLHPQHFPLSEQQMANCDMDNNGYIDELDILQIIALPYFETPELDPVEINGGLGDVSLNGTPYETQDRNLVWKHVMYTNPHTAYEGNPSDGLQGDAFINADLNGDGVVDFADYILFCIETGGEYSHGVDWVYGDIDGDGVVTQHDFGILNRVINGDLELPSHKTETSGFEWNPSNEVEFFQMTKRADYNADGEFHPDHPHYGLPNIDENDLNDMASDFGWDIPLTPVYGDVNNDGALSFDDYLWYLMLFEGTIDPSGLGDQGFVNADIDGDGDITLDDFVLLLQGNNMDSINFTANHNYGHINGEPINWDIYNYFAELEFSGSFTMLTYSQIYDFKIWYYNYSGGYDITIQDFTNLISYGDLVVFMWDNEEPMMANFCQELHGDNSTDEFNSVWTEIASTVDTEGLYGIGSIEQSGVSMYTLLLRDDELATNEESHVWGDAWTGLTWEQFTQVAQSGTEPANFYVQSGSQSNSYINIIVEHEDLTSHINYAHGDEDADFEWVHTWNIGTSINGNTQNKIEKTIEEIHNKAFKIITLYNGAGSVEYLEWWGIDTEDVINIEDGSESSVNLENMDTLGNINGLTIKINSNVVL